MLTQDDIRFGEEAADEEVLAAIHSVPRHESSWLHDLANNTLIAVLTNSADNTTTVTGSGVDMITGDGQCAAIQQVGVVSGATPTLNGKIQESTDNFVTDTGTDITGATFTQVTATGAKQVITFQRTKRWLRYVGTITGGTPHFQISAVALQQLKYIGS